MAHEFIPYGFSKLMENKRIRALRTRLEQLHGIELPIDEFVAMLWMIGRPNAWEFATDLERDPNMWIDFVKTVEIELLECERIKQQNEGTES